MRRRLFAVFVGKKGFILPLFLVRRRDGQQRFGFLSYHLRRKIGETPASSLRGVSQCSGFIYYWLSCKPSSNY